MKKQPDWIKWYPARILSDPDYIALDFLPRLIYRELLDFIALKGEVEWREDVLRRQYLIEPDDKITLALVKRMFRTKTKNDIEVITHPVMNEAREAYFTKVRQASEAAKSRWESEKGGSESKTDGMRPHSGRNANISSSSSSSSSSSNSKSNSRVLLKDRIKAEAIEWIEDQPEGVQESIGKAIQVAADTRANGTMSKSIVHKLLVWMKKYPVETVVEACHVYATKHEGKDEKYLKGIIRRMNNEGVDG